MHAQARRKSPAEKAGLKAGDIILKFDGKKIDTMRSYYQNSFKYRSW